MVEEYQLLSLVSWLWTLLVSDVLPTYPGLTSILCIVTTDTARCVNLQTAVKWSVAVAISTTSLLFFWRVRAVYKESRIVCGFFFIMWAAVACACVVHTRISFRLDVEETQQTRRCFTTGSYLAFLIASILVPMVNDVLIFCAITYRLMSTASVGNLTPKKRFMIAVFGTYLPAFSRTLLQDGQAYFVWAFLDETYRWEKWLCFQNPHPNVHLRNSIFGSVPGQDLKLCWCHGLPRNCHWESHGVQDIPED